MNLSDFQNTIKPILFLSQKSLQNMNVLMFDWKHLDFSHRFKNQQIPSFIPVLTVFYLPPFSLFPVLIRLLELPSFIEVQTLQREKYKTRKRKQGRQRTIKVNRFEKACYLGKIFTCTRAGVWLKKRVLCLMQNTMKATLEQSSALHVFHLILISSFKYLLNDLCKLV